MLDDPRSRRTFGHNNPLHTQAAKWDGHRSVRLADGDIGLATTAYSYSLSYEELPEAAERIALLWNLHLGVSNAELRELVALNTTDNGGGHE
jgi:hypothetical protein